MKINTTPKLAHNIALWNKNEKLCFIIDTAVGLDVKIQKTVI